MQVSFYSILVKCSAAKPYICDCWHLPTNSLTNVEELVGNCQRVGRHLSATGGEMKTVVGSGHETGVVGG